MRQRAGSSRPRRQERKAHRLNIRQLNKTTITRNATNRRPDANYNPKSENNLRLLSPKMHQATQCLTRHIVACDRNFNGDSSLDILSPKTHYATEVASTAELPHDGNQFKPGRQKGKEWNADAHGFSGFTRIQKKRRNRLGGPTPRVHPRPSAKSAKIRVLFVVSARPRLLATDG